MISTALADRLKRHNIHYGWVMAGVTFLVMLTTACALGAPGVLADSLAPMLAADIATRQRMLETADVAARLRLLLAVMEAGPPEQKASK